MTGKQCDRCGRFYKKNNTTRTGKDDPKHYVLGMYYFDNKNCLFGRHDLCDRCINALKEFLDGDSDKNTGN